MKRICMTIRFSLSFLFAAAMLLCTASAHASAGDAAVVFCDPDDPYYPVAKEIASADGIPVYGTLDEVLAASPAYVLWVASPASLNEEVLLRAGKALGDPDSAVSMGIISGGTMDSARALWQRAKQKLKNGYAIVNGTKPGKIMPAVFLNDGAGMREVALTRDSVIGALRSCGIVQVSMEGAARSWFDQHLGVTVKSEEIPRLDGCVIQNYGCSTFRPWEPGSIALACVDRGAAAYCGFVYSSVAGTRFGDYDAITLLHTWPGFPIGPLSVLQNRAAMQAYAASPHYFILGDPRLFVRGDMPYRVDTDVSDGGRRMLLLSGLPRGIVPVRVAGGADYDFVSVNGVAASGMRTLHFNSRLQMVDIGRDKYILFVNAGESAKIELRKDAPLLWPAADDALAFLDSALADGQGNSLALYLAAPALAVLVIGVLRRRYSRRELLAGLSSGALAALVAAVYALARIGRIDVTNMPVSFDGLLVLSIFLLTGAGAALYAGAKKPAGRLVAVALANLPGFALCLVMLLPSLARLTGAGAAASINKPGYPFVAAAAELAAGCVFCAAWFSLHGWILKRLGGKNQTACAGREGR